MSFRFAVPDLEASQSSDSSAHRLKLLLIALERETPLGGGQRLLDHLHQANRTAVATDDRLSALEALLPASHWLLRRLGTLYSGTRQPLHGEPRSAAALVRSLLLELAYGYKRVLMEHTQKLTAEGQKALPFLLCRTMRILVDSLITAYSTYSPIPAGVWQEIHHIFHYASFYGLDGSEVEDLVLERRITLAAIYREVLLFALLDPYHLQPGEAELALVLIAHVQRLLKIEPYRDEDRTDALFLIQASQDRPPRTLASAGGVPLSPMDKLIDTRPLVTDLATLRARVSVSDLSALPVLSADIEPAYLMALMARLERQWSVPPRRNFHRVAGHTRVEVLVGVPTIVAVQRDPACEQGQGREQWQVVNESPGGIALRREGGGASKVMVGEIIALLHADAAHWQPGLVRWVHDQASTLLECGVELMGAQCSAVRLYCDAGEIEPCDGLLLPGMHEIDRPALLVLPRGSELRLRALLLHADIPLLPAPLYLLRVEDHSNQIEVLSFQSVARR